MQSRLDAQGVEVRNDRVDVRDVIANAVGVLGDAGGHIDVVCPRHLFVAGSAEHVRRIITNLLTNASKYGDAPITIEVVASDVPSMVDIHVVDHGPGIPRDFQPIMYQRFARGLGTSNQPGTGLGVSIVRGLVEAAGGTVTYRRRDGDQATDFTVQLPMWPRPLGEAGRDHRAAAAASAPPRRRLR